MAIQANPSRLLPNNTSKEEIIAALRECAEKLGHAPSMVEMKRATGLTWRHITKHFGTYSKTVRAAGLERQGSGYRVPTEELFKDWAGIVRKLGKVPTIAEYTMESKYSVRPVQDRFGGRRWKNVSTGLLMYAQKSGLEGEWKDVLDIVMEQGREGPGTGWTLNTTSAPTSKPALRADRPTFGASLTPLPMAHAPTNELGVVFLFGMLAAELGFVVMRLQPAFPDCTAMRRVEDDKWQEVLIEFEFESRNFLAHMHKPEDCDMIVCWRHNWAECPLEVVELRGKIGRSGHREIG